MAGLNPLNGQHIRPVLGNRLLTRAFLVERPNGYFGLGYRLDLGPVRSVGQPPHTEDASFEPGRVRRLGRLEPSEFWQQLKQTTQPSLPAIFGPKLAAHGRGVALPEGAESVSLGNLYLEKPPLLSLESGERGEILRLGFADDPSELNLSVTDLRFYQPDHKTPKKEVVAQATDWLAQGRPVILSVGVGRAYQKPGDPLKRHWLHVNNLHFEQNPLW